MLQHDNIVDKLEQKKNRTQGRLAQGNTIKTELNKTNKGKQ